MYEGNVIEVSLEELYQSALIRAGQYLVMQSVVEDELPESVFVNLVKTEVYPYYTNYFFKTKRINMMVSAGVPVRFPEPAPEFISKIVPVSVYGLYIGEFLNFRFMSHVSYLSTRPLSKFSVVWKYERPNLYVGYQGEVMIEAQYGLKFDEQRKVMEIIDFTRDVVQDMCDGLVLLVLGRSRRMLKVPDNVVEFDAEAMVSEGEEMFQRAKENLARLSEISAVNF